MLAISRNVLAALCLLEALECCWSGLENIPQWWLQYICHCVKKCPHMHGLFLHVVVVLVQSPRLHLPDTPHSWWSSLSFLFLNSSHIAHSIQPNPYQTAHSASAIDLCLRKVQGFGIHRSAGLATHKHRELS